jgi:hypothetical protein
MSKEGNFSSYLERKSNAVKVRSSSRVQKGMQFE